MIDQYPPANGVLTSLIWRKTAAGGETSLSGYDNASQALSYTPGQEQVYLNGILLVRGDDYTATNGTSITGLAALSANDFVQINCYNNFSVASLPSTSITGEITNGQITSLATSKLTGTIANNQLANSSITINGSAVSLGGSTTIAGGSAQDDAPTSPTEGQLWLDTNGTLATASFLESSTAASTYTAKSTLTTTGDIYYASSASTPARLGIGSTGQVLTVSGGVPSWATASAGAIKQIVYAVTNSNTSASGASTSTAVDVTGLTATITPSSTSSKIWVSMWMSCYHARTGSDRAQGTWRLLRNSTEITNNTQAPFHMVIAGNDIETYTGFIASVDHVDSPNTTSATTYKIRYNGTGAGDESFTCYSGAHIFLMEI